MKNSETNTPGNSLATSEFRLLRRHQIALEGVLRLQREVEQKADSAAGHDVPEHFCSPRAEPVRHRTQRQNAADGEEHARAVKLRAARPKRVFYPEAKRLFSGTMLPSEGEAPVFQKKAACLQELLFPPEESRFFSLPFFAPVTARATSRARSLLSGWPDCRTCETQSSCRFRREWDTCRQTGRAPAWARPDRSAASRNRSSSPRKDRFPRACFRWYWSQKAEATCACVPFLSQSKNTFSPRAQRFSISSRCFLVMSFTRGGPIRVAPPPSAPFSCGRLSRARMSPIVFSRARPMA